MRVSRHLPGAIALLCVAALPLVAERLRAHPPRCEMDGVTLSPAFRVRVVEADGKAHAFCSVTCARAFLTRTGTEPASVLVTDGSSGTEIDARTAWFVRTVANRSDAAPDGIRVFASKDDAERHVQAYGGTILLGDDRPFAGGGEGHANADN